MSQDIREGWLLQVRGRAKRGWARIVGNEQLAAEGNAEVVAGALQESFGVAKKQAGREVTRGINAIAAVAKNAARQLER